jgi:hypothetical protein
VPSATSRPRPVDVLLNGLAKRFTEPYEKAVPTLARVRCARSPNRMSVMTACAGSGLPARSHRSPWLSSCGMTKGGMSWRVAR